MKYIRNILNKENEVFSLYGFEDNKGKVAILSQSGKVAIVNKNDGKIDKTLNFSKSKSLLGEMEHKMAMRQLVELNDGIVNRYNTTIEKLQNIIGNKNELTISDVFPAVSSHIQEKEALLTENIIKVNKNKKIKLNY